MSKWIDKFLKKECQNRTDRTDKPKGEGHLSVLSVPPQGVLDKNLENMSEIRTDRTDKPKDKRHLSVLSVPPQRVLDQNSLYPFEERIAIAHYEGHQSMTQAKRIAYLDDFVDVLITLPHKEDQEDWLQQRIKEAQEWLKDNGIHQPR